MTQTGALTGARRSDTIARYVLHSLFRYSLGILEDL